jgi:hypothetical protein
MRFFRAPLHKEKFDPTMLRSIVGGKSWQGTVRMLGFTHVMCLMLPIKRVISEQEPKCEFQTN